MNLGRVALIVGAMGTLAALDFAGSLLAKDYAERHRPLTLALGAGIFLVLFLVYARSLEYAELSIVTMGWIVLLQVGLVVLDWKRHGVVLDGRQVAAIVLIIALQCYLIVSAAPTRPSAAPPPAAAASTPA